MHQSLFFNKVEGLPFFIEHLWWLLLNMKSRHQQQQQEENSRKNLAAALTVRTPMKKRKIVQNKQTTNLQKMNPGSSISSHLEHTLEWI